MLWFVFAITDAANDLWVNPDVVFLNKYSCYEYLMEDGQYDKQMMLGMEKLGVEEISVACASEDEIPHRYLPIVTTGEAI